MRTTSRRTKRRNHTLDTKHKNYTAKKLMIIHDQSPTTKQAGVNTGSKMNHKHTHTRKTNKSFASNAKRYAKVTRLSKAYTNNTLESEEDIDDFSPSAQMTPESIPSPCED
jgi:hypothetical protein